MEVCRQPPSLMQQQCQYDVGHPFMGEAGSMWHPQSLCNLYYGKMKHLYFPMTSTFDVHS